MDDQTLDELGATAEVMGAQLSPGALNLMADDLSEYPGDRIRQALKRLRQESGRFTVSEIIKRMPGMWPSAEIAWAKAPKNEMLTLITTREALAAWDIACELDAVAGRMAFREAYDQLINEAKSRGESPEWIVSLGHDPDLREQAVLDAVKTGLLPPGKALAHLPHIPADEINQLALGGITTHALLERHQQTVDSVAQLVAPDAAVDTTTAAEAKAHIAKLRGILSTPDPEPEFIDQDPDHEAHKAQVQAELASLKKLHAERRA